MLEKLKWCPCAALLIITTACAWDCSKATALQATAGPDLSVLSTEERGMVESACGYERRNKGPAAYYTCLQHQLASLSQDRTPRGSVGTADKDSTPLSETPKVAEVPRVAEPPRVAEDPIEVALKEDEARFCQDTQHSECRAEFLRSIHFRPVTLSPSGKKGLIVELSAEGYCGSGGCAIYVLKETDGGYATVLEDIGTLDGFQVATSMNNGYYDLIRFGKMTGSSYTWTGTKYITSKTTDSASHVTATPAASPPSPASSSSDGEITLWLVVILVIGGCAIVLYKRATKKKCILCGSFNATTGAYCSTCSAAISEAARRASEQREAQQRARADEERRAREQREREENHKASTLPDLNRLTGPQFEALIGSLFKKDGYTVRHCGGSGDEGIDLVLLMGQEKDVVQCKRWKNDIGSPVLRDFYGALMHAAARHGFVITTASFTQSARDFAKGKPISLISGTELLRWINGGYSSRDQKTSRPRASTDNGAFDPYAVLGISRGANPEEIRAAYHREMVNYHPDKVAHLGRELQELAKTKAQEINRAYQELARSR